MSDALGCGFVVEDELEELELDLLDELDCDWLELELDELELDWLDSEELLGSPALQYWLSWYSEQYPLSPQV